MTKVIIVKNNTEIFTKSKCKCAFCLDMHNSLKNWDTYTPKTNLQKNMLKIVSKLEKKYKK